MSKSVAYLALFGGTERHAWFNPALVMRLLQFSQQHKRPFVVSFVLDQSPIDYARNLCVQQFLTTGADWLVMIDNDIIPPENFLNVLDDAELAMYKVINLPMPIYRSNGQAIWNVRGEETQTPERKWMYKTAGGGILIVHRSVFAKIPEPWFEVEIDAQTRKWKVGEDMKFSLKAQEHGFKTMVQGQYRLGHLHTVNLLNLMEDENEKGS